MSSEKIEGLLGPEVGYVDLMDNDLVEKQRAEHEKPSWRNPLRPSSAGACARRLAYEFEEFRGKAKYPPEEREPNVIRLLSLGSSIEYNVLRYMSDVEYFQVKYKQQTLSFFPLNEKEVVEGSIDFTVYLPKHRAIGDVKSKGDKWSSYRATKWAEEIDKLAAMQSVQRLSDNAFWVDNLPAFLDELADPFFADNFYQLNMYAVNPFIAERGIDHAFILRYNKNDSKWMEVRFRPSQEVYERVKDKFLQVASTIDADKPAGEVPKGYKLGSARCAFCRFNTNCWPDDNARKAMYALGPKKQWPVDVDRLDEELAIKLEELYAQYRAAASAVKQAQPTYDQLEEQLCIELDQAQIDKIRFGDGQIFEIRFLKSPRPRMELRPAKL